MKEDYFWLGATAGDVISTLFRPNRSMVPFNAVCGAPIKRKMKNATGMYPGY
jgi:hypothetical protein